MLLFMAAMLALAVARDVLTLFVAWEVTSIVSYALIGFDREDPEAGSAALMALLVTAGSALLFLVGIFLLRAEAGSFDLGAVTRHVPGPRGTIGAALIAVAALAKSAQVPLHFWLPRAMVAPTPVSAYLHSAALVAAGVFLLGRFEPLLLAAGLGPPLAAVGFASMAVGGALALVEDRMKRLLAYSTVAQYGYVTVLLGLGGAVAAAVYVLAHALAKSALFLAAGAVTEATGEDRLSRLGGLGRRQPLLAAATGAAAATLAGLPLTLGYFKDELFFRAALASHTAVGALAVAGAATTLAYTWRFWAGVFLGPARARSEPLPAALVFPVVVLAVLGVAGGLAPGAVEGLTSAAGAAIAGGDARQALAYHLLAPETACAVAAWLAGTALVVSRGWWARPLAATARAAGRIGPLRGYQAALHTLNDVSRRLLRVERRDLRGRVTPMLVPCAALVALPLLATRGWQTLDLGPLAAGDIPLALAAVLAGAAAIGAARRRRHLAIALSLSLVGFSLAAAYAFFGAPDVALVAVLIETAFTLLFVGVLALFPAGALRGQGTRAGGQRRRDVAFAGVAGVFAFLVAWSTLSQPDVPAAAGPALFAHAPAAHGRDAVTVVLADFRGLDTMGEITVVAVALVGILTLLGRSRRS
jgi:multicomponent Na+:H+ antiporter subunit A